jgi:toxin ParE1/3/4
VTLKPVVPRRQANRDVDETVDHDLREAGEQAAVGFINALERAYGHIARHPAAGSPRYAHELELPGLRSWPLKRYPCLVFFADRDDHIDVWRVLHGHRDLPAWMRQAEES